MAPKAIEAALADIEEQKKTVLRMVDAAEVAQRCSEAFPDLKIRCSVGWSPHTLNGALLMFDSKRVTEATDVLRWLVKAGFVKHGEPDDYAEIHRRTWKCYNEKKDVICLSAFYGEENDSSACRFVEDGVETKPKYKLICPESSVA